MKEIPEQYKRIVEYQTGNIMTEVEKLWPFVQELGDSFECECEDIKVIIKTNDSEASLFKFEKWLKSVCFQSPTSEAYELAKAAWVEANKNI